MANQETQETPHASASPEMKSAQRSSLERSSDRAAGERMSARRERGGPVRQPSPFAVMRRFNDEMDRLFDDFFTGGLANLWPFAAFEPPAAPGGSSRVETTWPALEVYRRGSAIARASSGRQSFAPGSCPACSLICQYDS